MGTAILPAESEPELTKVLLGRHRRFLEEAFPFWGSSQANALARQTGDRNLSALLWRPAEETAVGLAWAQTVEQGVRIHGLWIEPASPRVLGAFLTDFQLESPVRAVTDVLPGIGPEEQDRFFRHRGYWHRAKVLMRRGSHVGPPISRLSPTIRRIEPADLRAVTEVYLHAYSERAGEFWTWSVPSASAEAARDVMGHVNATGEWVPTFLPGASFVWEDRGRVLGAVLVERGSRGMPWIEDLVVEPEFHRQGMGRALLERAIAQIWQDGPRGIELAAIRSGAPYRLYRQMGFGEVPPPEGLLDGHWIRGASPC